MNLRYSTPSKRVYETEKFHSVCWGVCVCVRALVGAYTHTGQGQLLQVCKDKIHLAILMFLAFAELINKESRLAKSTAWESMQGR